MQRLQTALSSMELEGFGTVALSFSSGGVRFPQDGTGFKELCKMADETLYRVKEGGRRGCAFFEETGAGADRSAREGRPRHDGSTTDADPAARDA